MTSENNNENKALETGTASDKQVTIPTATHKKIWLGVLVVTLVLFVSGIVWLFAIRVPSDSALKKQTQELPGKNSVNNESPRKWEDFTAQTAGYSLAIDPKCYRFEQPELLSGIVVTCDYLGSVALSSNVKAVLKPVVTGKVFTKDDGEHKVSLEFLKDGQKLDIPSKTLLSYIDVNAEWFSLRIFYMNEKDIYVVNSGGHEGATQFSHYDGQSWSEFKPWELIKTVFPDKIQPPLSINVNDRILTITEENDCCERMYSDKRERVATRMVYVIDRATNKIISAGSIPR